MNKYKAVVARNKEFAKMKIIADILQSSKSSESDDFIEQLTSAEIEAFKYAPITSFDFERIFSSYKRVLEDCQHSFLFENLKKHILIHCNRFD